MDAGTPPLDLPSQQVGRYRQLPTAGHADPGTWGIPFHLPWVEQPRI